MQESYAGWMAPAGPRDAYDDAVDTPVRLRSIAITASVVLLGACTTAPPSQSASERPTLPRAETWEWSVVDPRVDVETFDQVAIGAAEVSVARGTRFWRSVDGVAWMPRDGPDLNAAITELLATDEGAVIAVGFVLDERPLFLRLDTSTFAVADVELGPSAVADITRSSSGYVAVGGLMVAPEQAYTWTSPDARIWSRLGGPANALFGPVAAGPKGWLVASNRSLPEQGNGSVELWLSDDARAWQKGPTLADAGITGISASPDGWVAVGNTASAELAHEIHATAWRSVDGLVWEQTSRAENSSVMTGLVPWRDGFVAYGYTLDTHPGEVSSGCRLTALVGRQLSLSISTARCCSTGTARTSAW